uniref:Mitochondrial fission factor n=1 Tax=Denticeps clupeoides TaxID=299321 RepID=A0AAY4ADP0_9TELE
MSESALSPNCAEMAETNRIHYELEYTEVAPWRFTKFPTQLRCISNGFDLIQSTPEGSVELKTPSYVLTLKDQPVKFLEPNHSVEAAAQPLKGVCCNLHRSSFASLSTTHNSRGLANPLQYEWGAVKNPVHNKACKLVLEIIKLNRRLLLLEQETKDRVRWEMYSVTVAFWLVNTWMWF